MCNVASESSRNATKPPRNPGREECHDQASHCIGHRRACGHGPVGWNRVCRARLRPWRLARSLGALPLRGRGLYRTASGDLSGAAGVRLCLPSGLLAGSVGPLSGYALSRPAAQWRLAINPWPSRSSEGHRSNGSHASADFDEARAHFNGRERGLCHRQALCRTGEFLRERRTIYERISREESDESLAS